MGQNLNSRETKCVVPDKGDSLTGNRLAVNTPGGNGSGGAGGGRRLRDKILREAWSYGKVIAFSLLATYVICSKIVTQAQVPSGSMENTIMTGSRLILNRVAYLAGEPERGDIVAFRLPDDESKTFLKRIIGLPGETVEGKNGVVYIDGEALAEPYIKETAREDFGPYTVPEECYFMMGDNRNNSWDSRFWMNKFVHKSAIEGKTSIEFYPQLKILE